MAHVADDVFGKQVVILGELPSHGEAHAFQANAEIVQRLVDECGYDALLFEAAMYVLDDLSDAGGYPCIVSPTRYTTVWFGM